MYYYIDDAFGDHVVQRMDYYAGASQTFCRPDERDLSTDIVFSTKRRGRAKNASKRNEHNCAESR